MTEGPEIDGVYIIFSYLQGIKRREKFLIQTTGRQDFSDYLNPENSEKVEDLMEKHRLLFDILVQLTTDILDALSQTQAINDIRTLFLRKSLMNDEAFMMLGRNLYYTFDVLSYLRTLGILLAEKGIMTPVEFGDLLKKYIPAIVGRMYLEEELEIPQGLLFLIGKDALRELRAIDTKGTEPLYREAVVENQLRGIREQTHADALQQGAHEKFAQKKADTTGEHARKFKNEKLRKSHEEAEKELCDFLQDFPDPRAIVDHLLELKDGEFPIEVTATETP